MSSKNSVQNKWERDPSRFVWNSFIFYIKCPIESEVWSEAKLGGSRLPWVTPELLCHQEGKTEWNDSKTKIFNDDKKKDYFSLLAWHHRYPPQMHTDVDTLLLMTSFQDTEDEKATVWLHSMSNGVSRS